MTALRAEGREQHSVTVVIPTFNERENCRLLADALVGELGADRELEILFVDDSTDGITPVLIDQLTTDRPRTVRLIHRKGPERVGGLSGAVSRGIAAATGDVVVVMDGDLQHPPEVVPTLLGRIEAGADLVVASRYVGAGDASGLSTSWRRTVSSTSTLLARACFPRRVGAVCTDPMTGFFAVRRHRVQLDRLRPRGFKILLEILARHDLDVAEVPFHFGERTIGDSKASWRNGLTFLVQMLGLRMGRMSRFAMVGAVGTVVNLLVLTALTHVGLHYAWAAVVAAEISILHNFVAQEFLVFRDVRSGRWWGRLLSFLGFNNIEALARMPLLILLVEWGRMGPVLGQALLLAVAFVLRFLFTSWVIYNPRRARQQRATRPGPSTGADQVVAAATE